MALTLCPSPSNSTKFLSLSSSKKSPQEIFFLYLCYLWKYTHLKPLNCTLSITCLICCNITFSPLSKCNLVPLIHALNAATKTILLICLLDHANTAPAISHQVSYCSAFYRSPKQIQELDAFSLACMYMCTGVWLDSRGKNC